MKSNNKDHELITSFLISETARLNSVLIKNGISSKIKRKSICEDYLFDYCNFMDEGFITSNSIEYFVSFYKSAILAFRIILKPFKKDAMYVAIFKNATDKLIISMIKQNIVGHLWLQDVVDNPNDKTIYKSIKTDIPIFQILHR
jgi:hypothetical protein